MAAGRSRIVSRRRRRPVRGVDRWGERKAKERPEQERRRIIRAGARMRIIVRVLGRRRTRVPVFVLGDGGGAGRAQGGGDERHCKAGRDDAFHCCCSRRRGVFPADGRENDPARMNEG